MQRMSEIMTHRLHGKATEEIDTSDLVTTTLPSRGQKSMAWLCFILVLHPPVHDMPWAYSMLYETLRELKRPSNNVHRPIQWRREVKWRRIPPQSSSLELQASFLSSILSLSPILCVAVKRRFVISSKSFNLSHSFSSAGIPESAHHWTKYHLP